MADVFIFDFDFALGGALSFSTELSLRLTRYKSRSILSLSHTGLGKSDSKLHILGHSPSALDRISSYWACRSWFNRLPSCSVSGILFRWYFFRTRCFEFSCRWNRSSETGLALDHDDVSDTMCLVDDDSPGDGRCESINAEPGSAFNRNKQKRAMENALCRPTTTM